MSKFDNYIISSQAEIISDLRKENEKLKNEIHQMKQNHDHWHSLISQINVNPTVKEAWNDFLLILKLS